MRRSSVLAPRVQRWVTPELHRLNTYTCAQHKACVVSIHGRNFFPNQMSTACVEVWSDDGYQLYNRHWMPTQYYSPSLMVGTLPSGLEPGVYRVLACNIYDDPAATLKPGADRIPAKRIFSDEYAELSIR